jgi:NAD dependent epimerase/dehydratase family enzyme
MAISKTWQRPCFMSVPAWLIKLVFGQMGQELLLTGSIVRPTNLINQGFSFTTPDINSCLEYIKDYR